MRENKNTIARSLLAASTLVSIALLLSRLSGLIREQIIGVRLGLTAETDAVILVLTLPDLLVGLMLSGGFSAALVPALARAGSTERIALMRRALLFTALGASILAVVLLVGMDAVFVLLAPSLDTNLLHHFTLGFSVSLVALPLAGIIGVASAYLTSIGKYSVPALSVLTFNMLLIMYFLFAIDAGTVNFVIFGSVVVCACFARLFIQFSQMPGTLLIESNRGRFEPGFGMDFLRGVLAYSIVVAVPIIFRSLYALNGPGDLAVFNFALRIFELPMGILIAPIVLVFLPLLSSLPGAGDPTFRDRTNLAVRVVSVLSVIAALIVGLFARPLVTILFGHGEMVGEYTERLTGTVRNLVVALPFFAIFQVMAIALNASRRTGKVLVCTSIALTIAMICYSGMQFFDLAVSVSVHVAFVCFHVVACVCATYAVGGLPLLLRSASSLGQTIGGLGVLVVPVAFFNPWLHDEFVAASDVTLILAISALLLLVNARTFIELAKVRDSQRRES